ncbi:MAG: DUF2341 domain-containing protein [Sphingobacteriales bacterium]
MTKYLFRLVAAMALLFIFNDSNAQGIVINTPVAGSNYNVGDIISATTTATAPFLGAVNKVVFTLGSLTQTDASSPYNASLNTSTLAAGSYTLTVTNYYTPFLGTQTTISTTMTINIASLTPANYSNYAFSKVLTLNSASLGITSNLTNFPALLYIQDNALKIAGACGDKVQYPNGTNYDFAFVNPNSAGELNYQVEKYDPVAGSLLVWVKIPALSYATNTPIYFYWGSTTPPVTHDNTFYQGTWASDYLAVFHFNESSYTGSVTDGTAGGHTGAATGMTSADLVTGKIGTAYNFDGSTKKITTNAVSVTGTFTLSAWVKLAAIGLDQKVMTNQAAGGGTSGGYKMAVYSTNIPESESGTAVNRASTPNPTAFASGAWHYIQSVYTGTTLSTYVDGAQYKVLITFTNPTANPNMYIGVGEGGSMLYFNGLIDEPRVSNIAKTADWIKAEYGDQNNPATFTTVGAATTVNTANAAAIPGALTYTWTGATSTDPTVATNWNNTTTGTANQLPAFNGTATLAIPTGLNNYPSLTANESLFGLTIANGASFSLNGHTLSVACNIYNSSAGQILYGASNSSGITWNGSLAAQSYNGANTANTAQLGAMTINNSVNGTVTINGGPVDIYNSLTITKGNLAIAASPAALTLKSTATQSASVGVIPAGSTITGNVNVERYITGGSAAYRGYRLFSSPVYASTISGDNVYSLNYVQASALVTGSAGGGFDKTGNPSLYLFRESIAFSNATFIGGNFRGVNSLSAAPVYSFNAEGSTYSIPAANGFLFFFRGDRTSNIANKYTPGTSAESVTMTASGTLNTGQIAVNNWYSPASTNLAYSTTAGNTAVRGFNLVGNPYASSIDWDTFQSTTSTSGIYGQNVTPTIYTLNPANQNYGAYIQGNAGAGTNKASNIIASGQGFFVVATNSSATLTFNESAKTATQATGLNLFLEKKPVNLANMAGIQYMRVQLAKDSVNTDELMLGFKSDATAAYNPAMDAPYLTGFGQVSISSFSGDKIACAINVQPLPKTSETIRLKVTAKTDGIYSLNMQSVGGIPQLFDIWLIDAYKKDSLDMRHNTSYSFNVLKSDSNTFGSNRFSFVIRQNPAYAYRLLSFTAAKASDAAEVQVAWKTENEQNYTDFTVERSTDNGKTFDAIGGIISSGTGTYNFFDKTPFAGQNVYRLKQEVINNTITYSNLAGVMYSGQNSNIIAGKLNIYPNPAINTINLAITAKSQEPASYHVMISNSTGIIVKQATLSQPSWQTGVSDLLAGTYLVQVVNNKDNSLVGQIKFVKL